MKINMQIYLPFDGISYNIQFNLSVVMVFCCRLQYAVTFSDIISYNTVTFSFVIMLSVIACSYLLLCYYVKKSVTIETLIFQEPLKYDDSFMVLI